MAVRIPIITVFDSKGLKQAQYQLNKVRGSFQALGRNFAIAGAAFGAVSVGLAKSVKVASDLGESINAVNVSFGKSAKGIVDFGKTASTTLGVSAVEFNNAAVRFSAFAERIVGAGGDASGFIKEITTRAADFASVFNIDVSEALRVFQSGLAGEAEPLKRFGINLLDSEVKAYAAANGIGELGRELTETEKVQARYGLLLQSTNQTAGDFANTSDGLANGMRILKAQLTDTQAEIGQALLPALQAVLPTLRELITEFGGKLKTAVESVDWKSTLTSLMNLLTFFIQNIETISKVVIAIYTLNTAFNVIKVTTGLINAGMFILGNTFTVTAGKIGLATGAVKLFRTALITTGIGALVVGLGFVIEAIINTNNAANDGTPKVGGYGDVIRKSGQDAEWAAGKYGIAASAAQGLANAAASIPRTSGGSVMDSYGYNVRTGQPIPTASVALPIIPTPTLVGGGGGASGMSFSETLKREGVLATRETKLLATGVSAGLADMILGTATTKKTFQAELKKLTSSTKAVEKVQARFNKTQAGQAELASVAAAANAAAEAAAQQAAAAAAAAAQAAAEQAAREAAILAEKKRVYESFANSITSTFARIQESILGAFSLPELGGSTDSIIRNMDKLLTRVKAFSANITKLSSMGLDPKLLQQVINAGPIAGAKLAANLVAGGVGGLTAINKGYSELGGLASEIGLTGTQAQFANATQQQIININIEGGLDSSAAIGKAVVDAVRAYERTSGAVWQGA
jgi:hypothetical protein